MSKEIDWSLKTAWIFHQADYANLRKAEGCQNLGNLPTTDEDKDNAVQAAKNFGILNENIHLFTGMNSKELNKELRRLQHQIAGLTMDNKRVFLFVYCAGHGVSD